MMMPMKIVTDDEDADDADDRRMEIHSHSTSSNSNTLVNKLHARMRIAAAI